MAQMKEQIKAPEKIQLSDKRDSQHIRRRVQNTGDQDAHRDGWVWSQNRGRGEGYEKWNNGKCKTGMSNSFSPGSTSASQLPSKGRM